ncbi:MAG: hypothetical protein JSV03_15285 [Planctomycetota bacterium]|nr:MAG: hypothetical protein JSV03_15285 [Planctomycetota bacterium]
MSLARIYRLKMTVAIIPLLVIPFGCMHARAADNAKCIQGAAFDATPFGFVDRPADGKIYSVRWAEPRKIRMVVVEFEEDPPAVEKVRLQYWHRVWDGRPDPVLAEKGAGGVGWTRMDDWTNGKWKDANTQLNVEGSRWIFTFEPTGKKEFKKLGQPGVTYRKTLKIRLISENTLPRITCFQTLTDAMYTSLSVCIWWGRPAEPSLQKQDGDTGHLEIYNGKIIAIRPIAGRSVTVEDNRFEIPANSQGGIVADLLMAVDPVDDRYDRTLVTVRSKYRPFSFAADEVARGDRILVDDLGMLAVRGDDRITLNNYRELRKEFAGKTVYDRVFNSGEQTLSRAWDDMPLRRPMEFVHGLPGNRNAMKQNPNNDVGITNVGHWFHRSKNIESPKDSKRKGWDGHFLWLSFGLPDHRRGGRELYEGYLPLLRTWWQDGPIYYQSQTILDKLEPDLSKIRLDDPTVLLMKMRVINTSAATKSTARLHLRSSPGGRRQERSGDEKLILDDGKVWADYPDGRRFRYLIQTSDRGTFSQDKQNLRWSLELKPGESHEFFFAIPSITLDKDEEIEALGKRNFDTDSKRVCDYWRELTARGAQIETPETWINDFYKSHARHLQVNCLKDLDTQRRYAHVGTFYYGVYCNESCQMISDLDRRGYHKDAEDCLQTWLDFQGTAMLPGNFKSKEGLFYGAQGSQSGGYNKHHGYVMWCMGQHWWYTRDREWMERSAPKLIKACEWVIRERQNTMRTNADGSKPIEYGFLPAGGLEDVQDYWYWQATNSATVWGFDALSAALADYGHPQAFRLVEEAKAYHDDVVAGLTESRIRAPVVRLRDGTYVPKSPSRLYERGRCYGWIRETLEGSIFLPLMGLVDPKSPETKWIMKDYEDNLYISEGYGYTIPVFDQFWFSRGGFSMQANLLDSPMPYLFRDEIKHYVRTYLNAFASAFEPDIRMCNEHSLPELGYPAGDHFKTSDESQSTYWLRLMFVHERDNELYLGQAIPRYWMKNGNNIGINRAATHFGPMSLQIKSRAAEGEIEAVINPPTRNQPKNIYLRIRHPRQKPIQNVVVNGKPYDKFDADKEWIILSGDVKGEQNIVARY